VKKCVLYARTSTPEEDLETQLCDLRAMAAGRGYEIVAVFTDVVSWSKTRRPGLDAMLKDARNRKFGLVLVISFAHIARSMRHFLQVMNELGSLGVEFISLRENIDTSGVMGRFFTTLVSSISKIESDLTKEKIRAGMRRRKLDGFRLGRQPLNINHGQLVRDRLSGMSLTNCSTKYRVSRASVVRFVRESQRRELAEIGGLSVGQETAVECVQ
jgi:DNA invertase Pin-like site-specific DNA recombinase